MYDPIHAGPARDRTRDSRFAGSFDPQSLEAIHNSYADEGWRIADGFLATSLWTSSKSELVMILERPASTEG